jgi:cell division protein FtsZ
VAQVAKECGALTIGVVTRPFTFEGGRRSQAGEAGVAKIKEHAHTLISIPNDRLLQLADKKSSLQDAFRMADDVLRQGIQGISELITVPGLINLDFADVRTIMSEGGAALMAVGRGTGEDRAKMAAEAAISSQLLDITIDGARGVLFNVTGGPNLTLFEVNTAAAIIRETAHPDVNLIFGAVIDPDMGDELRVTVIATGFERSGVPRRALERLATRTDRPASFFGTLPASTPFVRPSDSVGVGADLKPGIESKPASSPTIKSDDLDIPTFLRNRR